MKKTYINPEMEVVMIATQQMLAASAHVNLSEETLDSEGDLLGRGTNNEW